MSLLATFFLIEDSNCEGVIEAARAQTEAIRTNGGRPVKHDPFWEFMTAKTKQLMDFPFSGSVLLDIFSMKSGLNEIGREPGGTLRNITGSTFIFYGPGEAADAIRMLGTIDLSDAAVERYLKEDGWTEDYEGAGPAYREAAAHFKSWLAAVTEGYTGLFSLG